MIDATNLPTDSNSGVDKSLSLESLTDANWLFIKHYLETADIKKAYELADYKGTAQSAPYELFRRLKPFIEEIGNLAITSRIKLQADLSKALSLPLNPDKTHVSVSEWLRIRKMALAMTPEAQNQAKLSVLVVNRYPDKDKGNVSIVGDSSNNPTLDINTSNIIDADIVEEA
jgi:hypothetical protein